MQPRVILHRRKLLLVAAGISVGAGWIAATKYWNNRSKLGLGHNLFADSTALARIGAAYLAARKDQPTPAQLVDELLPDPGARAAWDDVASARKAFRQMQRQDFEAGNLVTVEGWFLARCEATLCALLAAS